jgi:hypothetical protein
LKEEETDSKKKKSKDEKKDGEEEPDMEDKEEKMIIMGAEDIQSLVIHTVSDLMDKGVLAESEDGKKIDLKENIEGKKKQKKKKKAEE